MTVTALDGPQVTKGWEAPLGSAAGTTSPTGASGPYISGQSDNPDAGPNVYYDGSSMKDPLWRFREGGGSLQATGYPNQALSFVEHEIFTADLVPSAISTTNIATAAAPTLNTPLTLVNASGAGITLLAAAVTVLNSQLVVPAGALQIDAAPAWLGFGTSGAIQGWTGAAVGRAISLTAGGGASLAGINFTIQGYDLYGFPQSEILAGPGSGATVNSAKTYKWMASITPSGTSANTVSVGTADTYGFPIRADKFSQTTIYWNNALITANTGFTAADATSPATQATGDPRGKYAVQSASDGTKALQIYQRMSPANMNTTPPRVGMLGVLPQ